MPAQQITSEQALVEVSRANSDIEHIYLQSGSQLEGHASRTYDLDRSSIAPEIYSAAFSLTGYPWASAHFLVSRVMAAPVSTIRRPLVALPLG